MSSHLEEEKCNSNKLGTILSSNKWSPESTDQLAFKLENIERILITKSEALEKAISWCPLKESEPQEIVFSSDPLCKTLSQIDLILKRHTHAENIVLKRARDLEKQLKDHQLLLEEIQMERDLLLERAQSYLEMNSSLRVRLEEQRCRTGVYEQQLGAEKGTRDCTLEKHSKALNDPNIQKYIGLEWTKKPLEQQETKVLCKINDESNAKLLCKKQLEKVLKEKAKLEERCKKLTEVIFAKDSLISENSKAEAAKRKISSLKRSKSLGAFFDHSAFLDPLHSNSFNGSSSEELYGNFVRQQLFQRDPNNSTALLEQSSSVSLSNTLENRVNNDLALMQKKKGRQNGGESVEEKDKKVENSDLLIPTQLNALKEGLANVTQKLKVLKSGALECDKEINNLPFKQKTVIKPTGNLKSEANICEKPKSEFKNLKNILEDAKTLNVKLQKLKEEKLNNSKSRGRQMSSVEVEIKRNEMSSQTKDEFEKADIFQHFQEALAKLKKAVIDWEDKLDEGMISRDEAFAGLVSSFSFCILSNLRNFDESEKIALSGLNLETDTKSLMDEESNKSRELPFWEKVTTENGGGDNLMKNQIADDVERCKELKIQITRLKCKIDHFQNFFK